MEVTKFWTKTKVLILLAILLVVGLIVGGIYLKRNNLKKEYKELETKINNSVVTYLSYEEIQLQKGEYKKINIKDIYKVGLARNQYEDDCIGYSIAEYNKKGVDSTTYIKCKNIYTTSGYGNESTKKENKDVAQ